MITSGRPFPAGRLKHAKYADDLLVNLTPGHEYYNTPHQRESGNRVVRETTEAAFSPSIGVMARSLGTVMTSEWICSKLRTITD